MSASQRGMMHQIHPTLSDATTHVTSALARRVEHADCEAGLCKATCCFCVTDQICFSSELSSCHVPVTKCIILYVLLTHCAAILLQGKTTHLRLLLMENEIDLR